MAFRLQFLVAVLACEIGFSSIAHSAQNDLLNLLPTNPGVVLVAEDLRAQTADILKSPFVDGLQRLPVFQLWKKSSHFESLQKARSDIEASLGMSLGVVVNDLLGDSVLLAMMDGPEPGLDDVHGLFLTKVRERQTLDKLIAAVNAAERQSGSLIEIAQRSGPGQSAYWHRKFQPGTKPDEWYAILDGKVFAWSNSEREIQDVLTRGKAAQVSPTGSLSLMIRLNQSLPERALARLFVDPRFIERFWDQDDPDQKGSGKTSARRVLSAIRSAGAALEWRDGLILSVHETLDPLQVAAALKAPRTKASGEPRLLDRIPDDSLAAALVNVDLAWTISKILEFVPSEERPRVDAALAVLRGIFLGKEPFSEILPALGPTAIAFVRQSGLASEDRLEFVSALQVDNANDVPKAIENGLRTIMAAITLDHAGSPNSPRLEVKERSGLLVTSLLAGEGSWSFALKAGVIAIGRTPESVVRALGELPGPTPRGVTKTRADFFKNSANFAVVNFEGLESLARGRRDAMVREWAKSHARSVEDVDQDLGRALELISLFQVGFVSSSLAADASSAHQTIGLIGRASAR